MDLKFTTEIRDEDERREQFLVVWSREDIDGFKKENGMRINNIYLKA